MFSNTNNNPVFASPTTNSPFSIGTNVTTNQTPFGRSPLFTSPSSGFGTSPSLYAQTSPKPNGLFSTTGISTQQAGFGGSNLFNPQQNTTTSGGNPLFSSGYAQQNKGFGFAFGTPPTSSLEQKGSAVKFSPIEGTDYILQKGVNHSIKTKLNCIVCMKEYGEKKSQEEIRWEDYEINRKGSSVVPTFGNAPSTDAPPFRQAGNTMAFGQMENTPRFGQVQNNMFGQNKDKPSFGMVENKSLFGQPTSGLTNLANQPNEQSPYSNKFGTFGVSSPSTAKPFGSAASPPAFGATSGNKPFAFTATSPPFGGNAFGSPQTQNTFNAPTPNTSVSQPVAFGSSAFGQTNTQAQNTNFLSKPSQPMFNCLQIGQSSSPANLFQSPRPTAGVSNFGKTDVAVSLTPFGKTAASTSFQSAGKIDSSSFNIGQQPNQTSFGRLPNPTQVNLGQPMPSAFGTDMQSMTNNFTTLHKPMAYGTDQNHLSMTSNYGLSMPQQQLASPFKSEQTENFHTIVDNIYESFPYRNVFDGISVKLYMDEDTTNPRMLNKMMEQESLPISSTTDSAKLRMLTGPEQRPNANPLKCKWLEVSDAAPANSNNFVLAKKSAKQLTLSKSQPTHAELLEKMLARITDEDLRSHFREQLTVVETPKINVMGRNDKSHAVLEDAVTVSDTDEKSRPVAKEEELISILMKQFFEHLKDFLGMKEEDRNNELIALPRGIIHKEIHTAEIHAPQDTTPPPKAESKQDNPVKIYDSDSEAEELSPSVKSSLKALLINDEPFKASSTVKSIISRLQNMLKDHKIPKEVNESTVVDASDSPPILDTCGIKLTREDYYTIPPLADIHKSQNEKGDCMIKGFTVGRHAFGNICFPDEMNVSNLDLDEIIHFHFHEIVVYPDDDKKPVVGEGLNRPGQVTLERVWPRHPITRKILTDPKDIEAENFVERLIRLSQKQDAVFVEYRPDTGSWVFRVEHFSKFSFTESDDEEVVKELTAAKHAQEEMKKKTVEDKKDEASSWKGLGGNTLGRNDGRNLQEIVSYQAKLTPVFEECTDNLMMLKYSFFDGTLLADLGTTQDSPGTALSVPTKINVQGLPRKIFPPKYTALLNHNHDVPKERTLVVSSTRSYMDGGVFKGQSFKPGWDAGFSFMAGGRFMPEFDPCSINQEYEKHPPNAVKCLKVEDLSRNPQIMYLKEHLEVVYAESRATFENSQVPLFTINENHRSLLHHRDIAESIDIDFGKDSSHKQVWDLCVALWGPEATTPTNRRELFSKWLEEAARPSLKHELKQSTTIKNIFIYLTGHKITEAAELARKERLPNLSLSITQSSGQETSKRLMRHQLEQWNNANILNELDKDIVKIYMLLGGVPFLSGINVCEDLDWKRALGVYFWYVCSAGTSLINALQAYQIAFVSGIASPPTPEGYGWTNGNVYDVLYQIMTLFVTPTMPLEKVVNPVTYTEDPLDYRLSWFLLQVFTALKLGTVSQQVTNSIHVSFAGQLEHVGLWEWSVFVLLFIQDTSYKTNAVMGILEKNLAPDRSSKQNTTTEDFLVNHFKIPSELVHSVLADKTDFMGRGLETYQHLILAKNWGQAHKVAVEGLIPDLVMNGQWEDLSEFLKRLIPGKGDILQWDTNVGLVLDYLDFNRKIINNKELVTELEIRHLKGELARICFRVKDFPTHSTRQKLAVAELSTSLVGLLKLLYCDLYPANVKTLQVVISLVKALPMPPDYKQDVLKKLCLLFFKN